MQLCLSSYKICPIPPFQTFLFPQQRNFIYYSFRLLSQIPDSLMGHHRRTTTPPPRYQIEPTVQSSSPPSLYRFLPRRCAKDFSSFIVCIHSRNNRPPATIEAWLTTHSLFIHGGVAARVPFVENNIVARVLYVDVY